MMELLEMYVQEQPTNIRAMMAGVVIYILTIGFLIGLITQIPKLFKK